MWKIGLNQILAKNPRIKKRLRRQENHPPNRKYNQRGVVQCCCHGCFSNIYYKNEF